MEHDLNSLAFILKIVKLNKFFHMPEHANLSILPNMVVLSEEVGIKKRYIELAYCLLKRRSTGMTLE